MVEKSCKTSSLLLLVGWMCLFSDVHGLPRFRSVRVVDPRSSSSSPSSSRPFSRDIRIHQDDRSSDSIVISSSKHDDCLRQPRLPRGIWGKIQNAGQTFWKGVAIVDKNYQKLCDKHYFTVVLVEAVVFALIGLGTVAKPSIGEAILEKFILVAKKSGHIASRYYVGCRRVILLPWILYRWIRPGDEEGPRKGFWTLLRSAKPEPNGYFEMLLGPKSFTIFWHPLLEEISFRFFLDVIGKLVFFRNKEPKIPWLYGGQMKPSTFLASLIFAVAHFGNFYGATSEKNMMSRELIKMSEEKPALVLAVSLMQVTGAYFAATDLLTPLYERFGLAASFGAHAFWNATVLFKRPYFYWLLSKSLYQQGKAIAARKRRSRPRRASDDEPY